MLLPMYPDRTYAESIVATVREPLLVLDADMKVVSANRSFYQTFKVSPEESQGQLLYDLGNRQWGIPKLRELLEELLPKNTSVNDFEVEHTFETIGRRIMLLNARRIYAEANKTQMILLAIEDITERRKAERDLARYREHLEDANQGARGLLSLGLARSAGAAPAHRRLHGPARQSTSIRASMPRASATSPRSPTRPGRWAS